MWLLFPVGFVVQVLRTTDLSPLQLLALLTSLAAFISIFLWLMLRYPFPTAGLTPRELRVRIGLLLALAVLALYVELAYGSGVPYRFMYVVIAAAVTLPTRKAAWMVAATTAVAGVVYAVPAGWDEFATSWQEIVPFPLIGIGMIAVSRLVVTVRELQEARREIAQLAAAEAVAKERLRFARDLHDLLGHSLSSITLKSELAGRLLPDAPGRAAAEVRDIQGVARGALREVSDDGRGLFPARDGTEGPGTEGSGAEGSGTESSTGGSGLSGLAERVAGFAGADFEARPLPEGGFRLRVSLPLRNGDRREDERR